MGEGCHVYSRRKTSIDLGLGLHAFFLDLPGITKTRRGPMSYLLLDGRPHAIAGMSDDVASFVSRRLRDAYHVDLTPRGSIDDVFPPNVVGIGLGSGIGPVIRLATLGVTTRSVLIGRGLKRSAIDAVWPNLMHVDVHDTSSSGRPDLRSLVLEHEYVMIVGPRDVEKVFPQHRVLYPRRS